MSALNKKDKQVIVNKSYQECVSLLRNNHTAFLTRGTGFGKTWIGSELASKEDVLGRSWSKVVYIVPLLSIQEGIKEKYIHKFNKEPRFVTYQTLGTLWSQFELNPNAKVEEVCSELEGMDNGLFVFEEAHRFGYFGDNMEGINKSSKFIKKIKERFPNAYYFGSTATPYRTDGADMGYTFFEGNIAFPYTLKDGINDGFYRKPIYQEGMYEMDRLVNRATRLINNSKTMDESKKKKLTAEMIRWAKFHNVPNLIKSAVEEADCPKDYMRFLVYFANHTTLNAKYKEVISWFQEVFPNMEINKTIVTSDSSLDIDEESGNLIYDLKRKPGRIDLVFSINKLVMGYHDPLITGVMLMRLTSSDIVYHQILGRCYDMEIEHQTIILDIVGNRDAVTGRAIKYDSILNIHNTRETRYPIGMDETCVEVGSRSVDVTDIDRLFNEDRLQLERELVWNYKNGRLSADFCAKELGIDVKSWDNVLKYHESISGKERHEDV